MEKILKLITVLARYSPNKISALRSVWTETPIYILFRLTVTNSCEQTVDIVNPPNIVHVAGD